VLLYIKGDHQTGAGGWLIIFSLVFSLITLLIAGITLMIYAGANGDGFRKTAIATMWFAAFNAVLYFLFGSWIRGF
jgi:hypothetical protein